MKLQIVNANDDILDLNPDGEANSWIFSLPDYQRRVKILQRYGRPGGFNVGDRQTSSRTIRLSKNITAENDQEWKAQISEIIKEFDLLKEPYYLVDTENNVRARIELDRITPTTIGGVELRNHPTTIDLKMLDGYWEDIEESTEGSPSTGTASGESIAVENLGDIDIFPVIEFRPHNTNQEFTLINTSTNDIMTVSSSAFVPDTVIIADSQEGKLFLDDGNTKTEISFTIANNTGFIFLAISDNDLEYQSSFGDMDIEIIYRNRYLY